MWEKGVGSPFIILGAWSGAVGMACPAGLRGTRLRWLGILPGQGCLVGLGLVSLCLSTRSQFGLSPRTLPR